MQTVPANTGNELPVALTDDYISTTAAAKLAGLSTDRIRQLAREGRIAFITTPYGRLYRRDSVLRYAAERRIR